MNIRKAECHPDRPYIARGMCAKCYSKLQGPSYYQRNKDAIIAKRRIYHVQHRDEIREYKRGWRQKQRDTVLDAYGGKCACCGESTREFLSIDHINDDGAEHRRKKYGRVHRDIINRGFPDDFRVLCHNCNSARYYYGKCPHERLKETM